MAEMTLIEKLEVLADAAKYDASCASSGTEKRFANTGGIVVPCAAWCSAAITLGTSAALYAQRMALTNITQHSDRRTRPGVGENLWMGSRGAFSPEQMVGTWIDEKRVFQAGPDMPGPVNFRDVRIGLPICEDIWGPEPIECIAETGKGAVEIAKIWFGDLDEVQSLVQCETWSVVEVAQRGEDVALRVDDASVPSSTNG